MTQKNFWNIDSNQLMTHLYFWFDTLSSAGFHFVWPFLGLSTEVSWVGVTFFGMCGLFWGLDSSVFPRMDSNKLMTQEVSRRVESTQLMNQAAFQGIDSESTHGSSGFPGNWLRISSRLKGIPRYWFKLTHESSEKHSILSRLMIQLLVVPTSGQG